MLHVEYPALREARIGGSSFSINKRFIKIKTINYIVLELLFISQAGFLTLSNKLILLATHYFKPMTKNYQEE